jgi:hypothetical protein
MLRFSKVVLSFTAFALLCLAAHATQAAPVVFTSRTTFDAAAPGTNTITFGSTAATLANSLTYSGVTFAGGTNYQVEVIDGTNVGAPGNFVLTSNTNTPGASGPSIVITPPANTTAFGFDIKSSDSALGTLGTGSYQITINGTPVGTVTPTYTSFSFIGFTSDVPITSITITALSGGDAVLDNVSFNGAAPTETPEPATMLLFGTGIAGAASFVRRRRRQQSLDAE